MDIQGFHSKARHSFSLDTGREEVDKEFDRASGEWPGPESVSHIGKVFHKGRCYNFQGGNRDARQVDLIVGILRFVSDQLARCVLIVPFSDTILGMECVEEEFKADHAPSEYVQVHKQVADIHVSDLQSESKAVQHVPSVIYEPQVPGSWHSFGYFLNEHNVKRKGRRTDFHILDVFAGAGGLVQGFMNAGGLKTATAVDNDRWAIATLTSNSNVRPAYVGDVREFLRYLQTPGGKQAVGPIDHVNCGSPCQGFSGANRNGGVNDEANKSLSMLIVDFVRATKCTTALFENVLGMWKREHIHYLKNVAKELLKLGYQVRCTKLRACDYGDPQKRERLFLFVSRNGAPPPTIPKVTHGDGPGLLPFVTVKDALSALQNSDGTTVPGLPNMAGRHTTLQPGDQDLVRLELDGLAPTIRCTKPPIHPSEDRCITVREAATLQGFPIEYVFHGGLLDQYRQVGNAVPVELATAIAQSFRHILLYEYECEETS